MAITNALATSFKKECMQAVHNFTTTTGHTFKIALYTASATMDATTTAYTATNEVAATGGYTATGLALTVPASMPSVTSTTAWTTFNNALWASSTITASGAMIYNDTAAGDPTVCVLDFGGSKVSSAGDFTVVMPAAAAATAIVRIA